MSAPAVVIIYLDRRKHPRRRAIINRPTSIRPPFSIRDDLDARSLVDNYRERFGEGPLGKWRTDNDRLFGIGIEGVVGFGAAIELNADKYGILELGCSEPLQLRFAWAPASHCKIEIRVLECISDHLSLDEIDPMNESVEYDFFVSASSDAVYLSESLQRQDDPSQHGFWYAENPLV